MDLTIQSFHCHPDKKLLDILQIKFNKLQKYYDRIESCEITLREQKDTEGNNHGIEVILNVPGKKIITMQKAKTFEKAITDSIDDLKRMLVHYKEQLQEHGNAYRYNV